MNRTRAVLFFLVAATVPITSGCAGASRVRSLPRDAGLEVRYAASRQEIVWALPSALSAAGQSVVERSAVESATDTVIGMRGANLLTWGEVSRVLVEKRSPGESTVRVAARSRYVLDWTQNSERYALRIVEALDQEMGPNRIAPFEGLRIRGVRRDGMEVEGVVGRGPDGSFTLTQPSLGRDPIPLATLDGLAAHRGSFGRGIEGMLIGGGLGLVVAMAQVVKAADCANRFQSCGNSFVFLYAVPVGTIVGYLLGNGARKHVWSPMDPSRIR